MLFAVNIGGVEGYDQYVFLAPNGLAVVGLAPSHSLVRAHREATNYQPLQLQYVPPSLPEGVEAGVLPDMDEDGLPTGPGGENAGRDASTAAEGAEGDTAEPKSGTQAVNSATACKSFPIEQLAKVNYNVGGKDRSSTKLSGKRRNQGIFLNSDSVLCKLESSQGETITVWAAVKGKLLEVNQQAIANPKLVMERPCREGYLAVLFPHPDRLAELEASLTPLDQYLKLRSLTAEDIL